MRYENGVNRFIFFFVYIQTNYTILIDSECKCIGWEI